MGRLLWSGKDEPERTNHYEWSMRRGYSLGIESMRSSISGLPTIQQKEQIIDLLMKSVKVDLFGSSLTQILFDKSSYEKLWRRDWIPRFPVPRGCRRDFYDVPIAKNVVIAMPYRSKNWEDAITHLATVEYDAKKNRTEANYFPELGLFVVINGRHHLAAASLKYLNTFDSVSLEAYRIDLVHEYPLSTCFPYFATDGATWRDWRDSEDKLENQKVEDVRFALLYGLAREKWLLTHSEENVVTEM